MKSFAIAAAIFAALALTAAGQDDLPEGKGRDVFVKMCAGCHGLSSATRMRESKKGWERQVNEMIGRGAVGSDDEIDVVISYLAANFGKPVNVNTAARKDLQEAFGLTSPEADAIVKYRQDHGDFKDLDALLGAPGVAAAKIQPLAKNIVF